MGSDVYMKDQWSELRLIIEWWMFCIVSLSLIKSTKLLTCSGPCPLLFCVKPLLEMFILHSTCPASSIKCQNIHFNTMEGRNRS